MDYTEKIKQARKAGYSDAQIRTFLSSKGVNFDQYAQADSFSGRASDVIKKAGESVYSNIAGEGAHANETPVRRGFQATAEAFNAVPAVAAAALPEPARNVLGSVGQGVSKVFTALTGAIGDIPALQKWVMSNPQAVKGLEEIAGTTAAAGQIAGDILAVDQGAKAAQFAVDKGAQAAAQIVPTTKKLLNRASEVIKPTPTPEKALGEVLQAKKPLGPKELQTFSQIDTAKVKTFSELEKEVDKSIGRLSENVDNYLAQDPTPIPLEKLVTQTTSGSGRVIERNFVSTALEHLKEFYKTTVDDVGAADIEDLIQKAKTTGLTRQEVNDISRLYNSEFGGKAFSKLGEPLTSVNAQAYENVRTGLKDVARQGLGGSEAAATDKVISSLYDIKSLVKRNAEAVQKLQQKISSRGVLAKVGSALAKYADIMSGGSIRGFIGGLLPRGAGYKVMNALDLEEKLRSNLNVIEKALQSGSDDAVKSAVDQLFAPVSASPQPIAQNTSSMGNAAKSAIVPTASIATPRDLSTNSISPDTTTQPQAGQSATFQEQRQREQDIVNKVMGGKQIDPTGMVGVGGTVARTATRLGAKLLHEDTNALLNYIDHINIGKDVPEHILVGAERVLEKLGGNINWPTAKLVKLAEKALHGEIDTSVLYKTGRSFKGKAQGATPPTSLVQEAKGKTLEEFVKAQQEGTLFHGASMDLGDNPTLKRGYGFGDPGVYTGQDYGGVFFTPSEKYALQYAGSARERALYSYKLTGKEKIFDISNPDAVKQFIDNAKNWEGYSSPKEATDAAKRIIESLKESSQYGAADWATLAGYENELEMSGFHGAKLLERPGENIEALADGSFKVSGKPVYSYGLFKGDIPVQRAMTKSQLTDIWKKANKK